MYKYICIYISPIFKYNSTILKILQYQIDLTLIRTQYRVEDLLAYFPTNV